MVTFQCSSCKTITFCEPPGPWHCECGIELIWDLEPPSIQDGVVAFLRENFRRDGAEGESVHKLCDMYESLKNRYDDLKVTNEGAEAALTEIGKTLKEYGR